MKHIRKISSPTWVTFGLVEAGVTSGIPLACAIEAASSVRADEHSPISATTWSRAISFFAAVADSPASERLSSTTSSTGRRRTPPSAFSPSTATVAPRSEASPNEASWPVIDMKKPILIGSAPNEAAAATPASPASRRRRLARQRAGVAVIWHHAIGPGAFPEERKRAAGGTGPWLFSRLGVSFGRWGGPPPNPPPPPPLVPGRRPERLLRPRRRQPRGDGLSGDGARGPVQVPGRHRLHAHVSRHRARRPRRRPDLHVDGGAARPAVRTR